ncbi:unnamed protein product [Larinioides sclopetarius]|uniref:Uncharacterized protein n=1 Tax=Larinioides sclopetarius TaxID=280406 RepID=A0AAV1ZY56_9ARAC
MKRQFDRIEEVYFQEEVENDENSSFLEYLTDIVISVVLVFVLIPSLLLLIAVDYIIVNRPLFR